MRTAHGCNQKSMFASRVARSYHPDMETTFAYPTAIADTRTVTLELSETQWLALRAVEPDAVGWLHAQVRNRLASSAERQGRQVAQPADTSQTDEY
jgi:hypothetical protein